MTPAQRAMATKPTPAQIRRVTDACRPQPVPAVLASGIWRGWRYDIRDSWVHPGYVSGRAWRDGQPEMWTEVRTLDEARAWLRELAA